MEDENIFLRKLKENALYFILLKLREGSSDLMHIKRVYDTYIKKEEYGEVDSASIFDEFVGDVRSGAFSRYPTACSVSAVGLKTTN